MSASLLLGLFPFAFQQVSEQVDAATATFDMFVCTLIFSFLIAPLFGVELGLGGKLNFQLIKKSSVWILGITVSAILGNYIMSLALQNLSPALTITVHRLEVLFVILLSFLFLKEPYSKWFPISGIVCILGVWLIQDTQLEDTNILDLAILLPIASGFFFSIMAICNKKAIFYLNANQINIFRLFLSIPLLGIFIDWEEFFGQTVEIWLWAAAASVFGPFVTRLCTNTAMKYIPVSLVVIILGLAPVISYIVQISLDGQVPSFRELCGSFIICAGVLASLGRMKTKLQG